MLLLQLQYLCYHMHMKNPDDAINELTLVLMYLTRFSPAKGFEAIQTWKGYPFSAIEELENAGCITQKWKNKSAYLTEEGLEKAKVLLREYGIDDYK